MLPKKNRANTKTVEEIFKKGRIINSLVFSFRFILTNKLTIPRISFIAPKNIAKLAVKRNLLRRRGYVVLKKYIGKLPKGLIGVFVFKKFIDFSDIENEIKVIFDKFKV